MYSIYMRFRKPRVQKTGCNPVIAPVNHTSIMQPPIPSPRPSIRSPASVQWILPVQTLKAAHPGFGNNASRL